MAKLTGVRAVMALRSALDEIGLVRTSGYNGGELVGWIPRNQYGATGMSIRPGSDGMLTWHVVISGKPHMSYRRWTEQQGDDDTIDLHEPRNPEVVAPRIRAAFESLGLDPATVEYAGAQMHWDDDVSFNVKTAHPDWLGPHDPSGRSAPTTTGNRPLVACAVRERLRSPATLAAYRVPSGNLLLPRESVEFLVERLNGDAEMSGYAKDVMARGADARLADDGTLSIAYPDYGGKRFSFSTRAQRISDEWSESVEVWTLPRDWAVHVPSLRFDHPVRFGDETVDGDEAAPFLDAQFGFEAPFLDEPATGPRP